MYSKILSACPGHQNKEESEQKQKLKKNEKYSKNVFLEFLNVLKKLFLFL